MQGYRIPLTKNGVNVCSFSRRTSASGRLRKFGGCARSLRSRLHPARQITRPRTELQATASRALRSPALLAAYLVPATQHEVRRIQCEMQSASVPSCVLSPKKRIAIVPFVSCSRIQRPLRTETQQNALARAFFRQEHRPSQDG